MCSRPKAHVSSSLPPSSATAMAARATTTIWYWQLLLTLPSSLGVLGGASPSPSARPVVLIDACNCGLRFVASKAKRVPLLLSCAGDRTRGARDLGPSLNKWLLANDAFGACVFDGKADAGRYASRHYELHARLSVEFTAADVSADDVIIERCHGTALTIERDLTLLRAAEQLESSRGKGASGSWVQLTLRQHPPYARESELTRAWARPSRHVYTCAAGSAPATRLASQLRAVEERGSADGISAPRLSRGPALVVTADKRLRSACERAGAIVVAPALVLDTTSGARTATLDDTWQRSMDGTATASRARSQRAARSSRGADGS